MKRFVLFVLLTSACSAPLERTRTLRSEAQDATGNDDMKTTPVVIGDPKDNDGETQTPVPPVSNAPKPTPTQPAPEKPIPDPTPIDSSVETIACTKSTMIRTTKVCETTVAGIQVKFFPLAEGVKASRLALYLHGDTAGDWKNPFVAINFASWAVQNKVLIVMPLSTAKYDDDPVGDQSYGAAQPADAEKLATMVENFVGYFKTPRNNLLYSGVSGGPWFMASSYIPHIAGRFPGLFALSCGASTHWNKAKWDFTDAAVRSKIKIFFNYGDKDFLRPGNEKSFDYYQKAGFEVSRLVHPGAEHCAHDVEKATIAFWEKNM